MCQFSLSTPSETKMNETTHTATPAILSALTRMYLVCITSRVGQTHRVHGAPDRDVTHRCLPGYLMGSEVALSQRQMVFISLSATRVLCYLRRCAALVFVTGM